MLDSLIKSRVYLRFRDPDGERGSGVPFGAFGGTVHSQYQGPYGEICYYVLLDEFLLLHRDDVEIKGEVIGISPGLAVQSAQKDVIADSIKTFGRASGDATLVRRAGFPPMVSPQMMVEDSGRSSGQQEFIFVGNVEVTIKMAGVTQ